MTLPIMMKRKLNHVCLPAENKSAADAPGGCVTPHFTMAATASEVDIVWRIQGVIPSAYPKARPITMHNPCPRIILRGCDAGAEDNPYKHVIKEPNKLEKKTTKQSNKKCEKNKVSPMSQARVSAAAAAITSSCL